MGCPLRETRRLRKRQSMGIASAFALPPLLFELRRTGRASADKSLYPSYGLLRWLEGEKSASVVATFPLCWDGRLRNSGHAD
jgi:hypothetical protein